MPPKCSVTVRCPQCGDPFETKPGKVRQGRKYCSLACYHAAVPAMRRIEADKIGERFWKMVAKTGDATECWLWKGRPSVWGYGRMMINGRRTVAHRIAWELTNGPIPDGLLACHNCPGGDNPLCCNPSHLFLGTSADNSHDMAAKGRAARRPGEGTATAKLTDADVLAIRARYRFRKVTQRDLAAAYGVSVVCIDRVLNRRSWRHI